MHYLTFITEKGMIKKTDISLFDNINKTVKCKLI